MKILSIKETKNRLIDFLFSRSEYMRRVNEVEFQTRCPYCGDSYKDLNTGHFYIRIDPEDTFMIPCICFKCDYRGIINRETLSLMDCGDEELLNGIVRLNKKGRYSKKFVDESLYMYFERIIPPEHRYGRKLEYIKSRIGIDFSLEDMKEMKVITSLYDFLIQNQIKESPFNKEIRMMLERDYVGFLSFGNSHILFRDITDSHKHAWIKYPIDSMSRKNKVFYGTASAIDIFTKEPIIINLSEGVMDAIGIRYHFSYTGNNVFNLAVCGQNYNAIILHMISIGVFGSNVTLNIFSDNDREYNDNKVVASSEKNNSKYLEKFKGLFNSINLYYNIIGKDYGVKKEAIELTKIQI